MIRTSFLLVASAILLSLLGIGCTGQGTPSSPIAIPLQSNGYAIDGDCWVDDGGSSYYVVEGPRPRHVFFSDMKPEWGGGVAVRAYVFTDQGDLELGDDSAASCVGTVGNSLGVENIALDVAAPEDCSAANDTAETFIRVDHDTPGGTREEYEISADMRTELVPPEWPSCD